jgi:N-acetylneuraminic acid mutarotase
MIVWGGRSSALADAEIFGGGAIFDVAANSWTEIPPPEPVSVASYPTFDHVAVWTGTEMIVWGGSSPGAVNSGWRYDPSTGVATAFRGTNAPSARTAAQAVWTGSEMIVWGGYDSTGGAPLNDGARYDPVADAWTPLPPVAATFTSDIATSIVWTGSEMILWNGGQAEEGQTGNDRLRVPTLHAYDPLLDTWRVSTSGWEPYLAVVDPFSLVGAKGYRAFWTGDRMLVMPMFGSDQGFFYDPVLDSWQSVTDVMFLGRVGAAAVWAGSRFVIWGGVWSVLPGDDGLVLQP